MVALWLGKSAAKFADAVHGTSTSSFNTGDSESGAMKWRGSSDGAQEDQAAGQSSQSISDRSEDWEHDDPSASEFSEPEESRFTKRPCHQPSPHHHLKIKGAMRREQMRTESDRTPGVPVVQAGMSAEAGSGSEAQEQRHKTSGRHPP